jgi:nucleoside-diphosphate-sugar epimerase
MSGMRVVVFGATGNVGTSVVEALVACSEVDEIIGVARRTPAHSFAKTRFVAADITTDDLAPLIAGADAVVHLAWLIQPSRDQHLVQLVNKLGSLRVFNAVAQAGVPALVYASSVGAYSPGPKDQMVDESWATMVDESWATRGIRSSFYSRHKVAVERMLDRLEAEHPQLRAVRLRPALIFKAQAATEIRRLFIGQLPPVLLRRGLIPIVPDLPGLRFQVVHSRDVGDAFARAVLHPEARGAFNLAAEPVIGVRELAEVLGARPVPVSLRLARRALHTAYRLHLSPIDEGWLDMALQVPLMDSARAHRELGWSPGQGARATLAELIDAIGHAADFDTPPLARSQVRPAAGPQ